VSDQRSERHDAAFTPVVGPQDQQHVFQRDHHHQAPENDGYGADNMRRIQRNAVCGVEDFLHGVQRTGTDVAIHHAQRSQGEYGHAFAAHGRTCCLTHCDS
jgi:hypothetical protein